MLRARHGWQVADDPIRCPNRETRWVNGTHGEPPRARTVRCARPRDHEGLCSWRNRAFGVSTVLH